MARPPKDQATGMSIELLQLAEIRDKQKEMRRKLDKHALLLEAMWQFMKAEFELEDDDLKTLVEKLDLADGEKDGKRKPQEFQRCPKCEEPVKGKRSSCFWCGHEFPGSLFDS